MNIRPACILSLLLLLFIAVGCSNDNNPLNDTPAPTGSWRISLFFDSGDETSNFSGYVFQFNSGGQLVATSGTGSVSGTWSISSGKMNISFGTTPVLDELNDDWLIEENSASAIKLKEDNPAQDDKLQFTRL